MFDYFSVISCRYVLKKIHLAKQSEKFKRTAHQEVILYALIISMGNIIHVIDRKSFVPVSNYIYYSLNCFLLYVFILDKRLIITLIAILFFWSTSRWIYWYLWIMAFDIIACIFVPVSDFNFISLIHVSYVVLSMHFI